MFRRKEDGLEPVEATNENTAGAGGAQSDAPATFTPPVTAAAPAASATAPTAQAATPTPSFRPVPPQAAMMAAQRHQPSPTPSVAPDNRQPHPATRNAATKRVLTVGPDIQMKGEITSCDRVVIEGAVDATMRDVHTVELAETGSLKGTAEVEDAEISGSFEGDLVVRGRLTVYSSGRVRGNVTYGEIEIQRGGQISGNVRNVADAKLPANHNVPNHGGAQHPKAKAA